MATLKEWLDKEGFDWKTGRIIYQKTDEDDSAGWAEPKDAEYIDANHPILTKKFYDGYGGPQAPRIIAEDKDAIYFPAQYDGATWLEKVWKNIDKYLDYENNPTPYPGG